ncbi:hypothetical protein L9F63_027436 [Diploptera punctata]|uniref:Immunoglobulin I-set domain-containing protein n=1 Tax=Diploptera punctata TaxID=6984 RepID=A0AAD8EM42_DIPPU|nr:hypothetical protein L9F63_027436 [Diploptera punctata]
MLHSQKPTLTWFNNDILLDDSDSRIHQQLADDYASIVVKNSKRSDTGQYRLQLKNPSGFDTATINVKVLDRPCPPENLRADEFAGDALTLFWNPPRTMEVLTSQIMLLRRKNHVQMHGRRLAVM